MAYGHAQVIAGDPGPNVNIVGPTPDSLDIRDVGLKQQNEPACAIRPLNPACMICAYNDNRTVDIPAIGDGWIGVSTSCDFGTTWTSRVAPGHNVHPAPIGESFAADPRVVALPGVAILGMIAGDRISDRGVIAVQHWLEINKEDADYYEPGLNTTIVDVGSEGRFLDKLDVLAVLDPPHQQRTVQVTINMENEDLGQITRELPSGLLYVAYAVFTGSNSVKVLYKVSDDWGQTWKNQVVKLSEDQNFVSGVSLTAIGNDVLAVWRRAGDINDLDSIMYSKITNRGKKATKGEVLTNICSFDQVSATSDTAVTFRTNDFPWATYDGKNAYVFYSDRNFDGNGNCLSGRPRIVFNHSANGLDWSEAPIALDDSTVPGPNGEPPAGSGFQFMPAAFAWDGVVQAVWFDTRREILPASADSISVVADYFDFMTSSNVFRQVNVYTTRIASDDSGNILPIPHPVRVSQFKIAAEIEEPDDEGGTVSVALEGEAFFANSKLYSSGLLSFIGDYIAAAAPAFRMLPKANPSDPDVFESNITPSPDGIIDEVLLAWGDNRDVRGSVVGALDDASPYSPPTGGGSASTRTPDSDDSMLAARPSTGPVVDQATPVDRARTSEGVEANETNLLDCQELVEPLDRARDANVYSAVVSNRLSVFAPTISKPLTALQRAFVIGLSNEEMEPTEYRLQIMNQPCGDPTFCRASFRQLPAVAPFDGGVNPPTLFADLTIPAESTLARTAFVVANTNASTVVVNVFEKSCVSEYLGDDEYLDVCPVAGSINLGGDGPEGPLQQPNFDSPLCDAGDPDCTEDVLRAELHNPQLINPQLINPQLINPQLINEGLLNPQLINPQLINPQLINPQLINLGFENPQLINPQLINPQLINDPLLNPQLINPQLINPQLINSSIDDGVTWVDFTFPIVNTGNVTTAFDADLTIAGEGLDSVDSQIIAWTVYATPTSENCQYKPQANYQVLAATAIEDTDNDLEIARIDQPFNGEISAIAVPGQTIFFTRRVFGKPDDIETISVSGFTAASQAANCTQIIPPGEDPDLAWFCDQTLADGRELIVLDTLPPTFTVPGFDVVVQADRPGGACANLVADGTVSAEDNGEAIIPVCAIAATGQPLPDCSVGTPEDPVPPGADAVPIPVTVPGAPIEVTCTAEDEAGNVGSASVFVDVQDNGVPVFDGTLEQDPPVPKDAAIPPDNPTTAQVTFGPFTATDVPLVDEDVTVVCMPESGSEFGIGETEVTCEAVDDGFNLNGEMNIGQATFAVVVADGTPPSAVPITLAPVEANAPGGANYEYLPPTFTDNFDDAVDITVICTPVSPAFLPLTQPGSPPSTITCTGTDTSNNSATVIIDVTIQDTKAPVLTVPGSPVTVAVDADGKARLDFEAQVSVEDVDGVDPSPQVTCEAPGGRLSGDPLALGDTTITCTATDASNNSSEANYVVHAQFGASFGIFYNKGKINSGSTVPLTFGWEDADGNRLDSSNADPVVTARDCATLTNVVLEPGVFPGNSDLRYDSSQRSWKFNWQTVLSDGSTPIPASKSGTDYCVQVESLTTGQLVPDTAFPYERISIRD